MPTATLNGVRLSYALTGDGPPLVLVHGSWGDRRGWDPVVPALARRFRVLAYDRRGHGQSHDGDRRRCGQGSVDEDAVDLAALIERLDLAPAHVAGSSFGGSIALRLATRRPDLFRSLTAHEPPLFDLVAGDPVHGAAVREVRTRIAAVAALIESGNAEEGARRFFEMVAVGPGAWERLPVEARQTLVGCAPTFLDETRDPNALTIDLAALAGFPHPVLLTHGGRSFPFYPPIVVKLAAVLPRAEIRVYAEAGHVPQASHPAEYATTVAAFAAAVDRGELD